MDDRSEAELVFSEALARTTTVERAAFLNDTCGDNAALRFHVEQLLAAHAEMGQFLQTPIRESDAVGRISFESVKPSLPFFESSTDPESLGRLDHYEILEVVGQGGMGVVLRAKDTKLQRVVAIKILASAMAMSTKARKWFNREARAAAAVRDDHVVAIHAVVDDAPLPYLVMEYIEGRNLSDLLRAQGRMEFAEILSIGFQIACGLAAAHKQGLIHRDVKPANILLESGTQRVKLTDFGLARAVDDSSTSQNELIAGTPMYMAPEQATTITADHRADLFSLGSVLYEMCTGHSAFGAPTSLASIKRVCEEVAEPIEKLRSDTPPALRELINRMHSKSPADRPSTAAEVAARLDEIRQAILSGDGAALGHGIQRGVGSVECVQPSSHSSHPIGQSHFTRVSPRAWFRLVLTVFLLLLGLGLSELGGVTHIQSAAVRVLSSVPKVRAESPEVSVSVAEAVSPSVLGDSEPWHEQLLALPVAEQEQLLIARLKELNPNFDGQLECSTRNGAICSLKFITDEVTDISPLSAIQTLEQLDCNGSFFRKGKLADLSPLRGLPLTRLNCNSTRVDNLEPLRGMPLKTLIAGETRLSDLSPLAGMELESLSLQRTEVVDLSPLRGMPIQYLDLFWAQGVKDLAPLEDMPLNFLNLTALWVPDLNPLRGMKTLSVLVLESVPVTDLSPLKDLSIKVLCIRGVRAADLSPIKTLPLEHLRLDYHSDREEFVRSFPGLKIINDKSAADFWSEEAICR